jgi:hypothetical protein
VQLFSCVGSRADGGLDVTGDGAPDLVTSVGSSGVNTLIRVFSCTNGALVRLQAVPANFTPRVSLIHDLDDDGRADIIVSDTTSSLGPPNSGVVRVLSGFDGLPLHVIAGAQNELLGWATTAIGDQDGDGIEDFATATAFNLFISGPLSVKTYSGATGAMLQSFAEPGPGSSFGWSIAAADLSNDGTPDLFVGVVGDAPNGYASGSVFAYQAATPLYDVVYRGEGCGSAMPDPPVLQLAIQATASATISFLAGPPFGTGTLAVGALLDPPVPVFSSGCFLSLDPAQPFAIVAILGLSSTGAASLPVALPTNLGGTGITFHAQGVVAGPTGLGLTRGVSLRFN